MALRLTVTRRHLSRYPIILPLLDGRRRRIQQLIIRHVLLNKLGCEQSSRIRLRVTVVHRVIPIIRTVTCKRTAYNVQLLVQQNMVTRRSVIRFLNMNHEIRILILSRLHRLQLHLDMRRVCIYSVLTLIAASRQLVGRMIRRPLRILLHNDLINVSLIRRRHRSVVSNNNRTQLIDVERIKSRGRRVLRPTMRLSILTK